MTTKKERITQKIKELLAGAPSGLRFSELIATLKAAFPEDPHGTITGTVWNIDIRFPEEIYKPSRGVFRLTKFRTESSEEQPALAESTTPFKAIRESDFYEPFADYLTNELEECTKAIALGGNRFGAKWGTPDVFGILKSRESDIVKVPLEVVVAEIKTDTLQLIGSFSN